MKRVLVTGATGFVGREIITKLVALGNFCVQGLTRLDPSKPVKGVQYFLGGDIAFKNQLQPTLDGVHTLIHTAARAHVLEESVDDPLAEFRRVNVYGSLRIAEQAAAMGVRRFIFISSIGVNGVQSMRNLPFSETDEPRPHNAYAVSKWEAEQGLMRIAGESGLEVVIIRPPLVYGFGAPGNFGFLTRAVQRGWPLPLGAVHNQRSLVALDNLVDFIVTCINHPEVANQTFLVSDGQDLSTTELVRGMAQAAGVPARLMQVPVWTLQVAATLAGKADLVQRLCSNLQVDISKARNLLGWVPPVSVSEGLRRAMIGNRNI